MKLPVSLALTLSLGSCAYGESATDTTLDPASPSDDCRGDTCPDAGDTDPEDDESDDGSSSDGWSSDGSSSDGWSSDGSASDGSSLDGSDGDGDVPDAGMPVPGGGYIRAGAWGGYAWTATGGMASISPSGFGAVTDFPLCASGTLQPGYANVAMIGWNLHQASVGVNPPLMTVVPAQAGIRVAVSNPGRTELRLQIQGPRGDASDRWCAVIPGSGGFIPYDAFNTECWAGGAGVAYAGEPIVAALVLVSGRPQATPYEFCVDELVEADGEGTPPGMGCALSGPGSGTFQLSGDDTASVTRDGRNYRVQNNVWNGSTNEQALSVEGVSFEVTKQNLSRDPRAGAPASYPSVFIGSNFGRSTNNSNLPKQVSALTRVPTAWRWQSANGVYNAAYDVWFSRHPGGDATTPSAGYLMVWFYDPTDAQPLGEVRGSVEVAGKSWQVWVGTQNGVPAISYVPNGQTLSEWSFDLQDFIRNASAPPFSVVQPAWYLTNVFAGFEIWQGGVGLRTSDFCAIVE